MLILKPLQYLVQLTFAALHYLGRENNKVWASLPLYYAVMAFLEGEVWFSCTECSVEGNRVVPISKGLNSPLKEQLSLTSLPPRSPSIVMT